MTLINELNNILENYLPGYSWIETPEMKFSEDKDGNILFNGCYLCSSKDLKYDYCTIEYDKISIYFNKNIKIVIEFEWEEDTPPNISSFGVVYC